MSSAQKLKRPIFKIEKTRDKTVKFFKIQHKYFDLILIIII